MTTKQMTEVLNLVNKEEILEMEEKVEKALRQVNQSTPKPTPVSPSTPTPIRTEQLSIEQVDVKEVENKTLGLGSSAVKDEKNLELDSIEVKHEKTLGIDNIEVKDEKALGLDSIEVKHEKALGIDSVEVKDETSPDLQIHVKTLTDEEMERLISKSKTLEMEDKRKMSGTQSSSR